MADPHDSDVTTQSGSTTRERFARVRAIFEAAMDRPEAERRACVAGACAGDPVLLGEVEAMLDADARSDARLPRGGASPAPSSTSTPGEGRFPTGSTLADRYRIQGLLGHGGMGEVYRAFENFSAWYSIYGLILTGLTVALALWSFRYALGGRKIWAMDILDN